MLRKHKLLLISQVLCAVPSDENGFIEEGKVKAFNMTDYASMLRTFGPDYLEKDDVPDILKEQVNWKE